MGVRVAGLLGEPAPTPRSSRGVGGTEEGWLGAGAGQRGGLPPLERAVPGWPAGCWALLANAWIILSISAKQQKHKPLGLLLCFLAGTHILAAVPLTTFAVVQLRARPPQTMTGMRGICKVFVHLPPLALATCFTVASLSYRMWMVRWPVNYRLSLAKKQALRAVMGIWMVSFILSTLPLHRLAQQWRATTPAAASSLSPRSALGFGVCFSLLLLRGIVMGLVCVASPSTRQLWARPGGLGPRAGVGWGQGRWARAWVPVRPSRCQRSWWRMPGEAAVLAGLTLSRPRHLCRLPTWSAPSSFSMTPSPQGAHLGETETQPTLRYPDPSMII